MKPEQARRTPEPTFLGADMAAEKDRSGFVDFNPRMSIRAPSALSPMQAESLTKYLRGQSQHASESHAAMLSLWADAIEHDYVVHPMLIIRV